MTSTVLSCKDCLCFSIMNGHSAFSYSQKNPSGEELPVSVFPIISTPRQILFSARCSTIGSNGGNHSSPVDSQMLNQCWIFIVLVASHLTGHPCCRGTALTGPLHHGNSVHPELNTPASPIAPHKALFPDLSSTDDTLQANSRLSVSLLD